MTVKTLGTEECVKHLAALAGAENVEVRYSLGKWYVFYDNITHSQIGYGESLFAALLSAFDSVVRDIFNEGEK